MLPHHMPVFPVSRATTFFYRRCLSAWRRRTIGLRRESFARQRSIVMRQRSFARQRGSTVLRQPVVAATSQFIAAVSRFSALRQRSIALQRGSAFLRQGSIAATSQFIAVLSQFVALRRPFISVLSQLRLEVIAVFAMKLRLRLRCRKWPQKGGYLSSSQSQNGTNRRFPG